MSQEKQGKKMSPAEKSLAGKDDKIIPVKPTALSDADLDNVAGGIAVCGDVVFENDETFSLNAKRAPKRK